jgi:hypothetical protein
MGCWVGTCGITGLPLPCGTPCVAFLLAKDRYDNFAPAGYSMPQDAWQVVELPLFGKYNDYGALEKTREDANVRRLLESLPTNYRVDLKGLMDDRGTPREPDADDITYVFERGEGKIFIDDHVPMSLMLAREDAFRRAVEDVSGWREFSSGDTVATGVDRKLAEATVADPITDASGKKSWIIAPGMFDVMSFRSKSALFAAARKDPSVLEEARDFLLFDYWMCIARKFYSPQGGGGMQQTAYDIHASMLEFAAGKAREGLAEWAGEDDEP